MAYLKPSERHTIYPRKSEASNCHIEVAGDRKPHATWTYPLPKPAAKRITGYVAFYLVVKIEE